jgi:uncharacterized membrane protein
MPDTTTPAVAVATARVRRPMMSRPHAATLTGAVGFLLAMLGCAEGDRTLAEVDPQAAPLHPAYEQVFAIVEFNCAPCHGGGGAVAKREEDEEDDLDYATCQGIQNGIDGLRSTVLEAGSMPPGAWPRITERDKLLLQRWIDAGACSPCTAACP